MHICCKIKLEKELITIGPKFDKLITALRVAVDNDRTLEKEATSYGDISMPIDRPSYQHESE